MGEEAVLGIGSPITQCGSHLPQAVEPTSIQEVCKGEGVGEEELQTQVPWLEIEEVHQVFSKASLIA